MRGTGRWLARCGRYLAIANWVSEEADACVTANLLSGRIMAWRASRDSRIHARLGGVTLAGYYKFRPTRQR